jgi:hypothetical protein
MKRVLFGLLAALTVGTTLWAAERPGTPLSATAGAAISQDSLARAVENYIAEKRDDKGVFAMKDEQTGQQVHLTLDKVSKDNATVLAKDKYFMQSTFKGSDGKSYAVDFILKPALMGSEIKVSDAYIQKVDGVERYRWMQDKDDWKRETIPAAANPM